MEPQFTPKTRELLDASAQLRAFIKNSLPGQVQGQDISTLASPYRQNEDSLQSALDRILNCLDLIELNIQYIDQLAFNQKNNLHSYISQVLSWLQQGVLSNWPSVISYAETIQNTLSQSGVSVLKSSLSRDSVKTILSQLNEARTNLGDIKDLQALKRELTDIITAKTEIPAARALVNTIESHQDLIKAKEVAKDILNAEDKYKDKLDNIIRLSDTATLNALGSQFRDTAEYHKKISNKWLVGVFAGILFFTVSATYVVLLTLGYSGKSLNISEFFESASTTIYIALVLLVSTLLLKFCPYYNKNQNWLKFTFILSSMLLFFGLIQSIDIIVIPPVTKHEFSSDTILGIISGLLVRSIVLAPSIILLIYVSNSYRRNINLAQEYTYKFIASATFDVVIKKVNDITDYDSFKSQNIIESIITGIYKSPTNHDEKLKIYDLDSITAEKFINSPLIEKMFDLAKKIKS